MTIAPDAVGCRFDLMLCTSTIIDEVRGGLLQMEIAVTYAMAIRSHVRGIDKPDWSAINAAILARWKPSGLERIKKRAHDIVNGKVQP